MSNIRRICHAAALLALSAGVAAQAPESTTDDAEPLDRPVPERITDDAEPLDGPAPENVADDAEPLDRLAPESITDEAGPLDQQVPVAADDATPEAGTGDGEPGAEPTEDLLVEEFARFRRLLKERANDEADVSAKRIVEMAIRIYGPRSHETARALNNLAIVQHNNRQYEAAVQNFTSAIEILEDLEDRLNEQLVNPLKGLGAAQLGTGRPDLAARTFGRATHITHVNEGPHNVEQVEILESLAESNMRMGDVDAAKDVLERIHAINVRHFRDNTVGLIPSLMRRASWQHRAGYYNEERVTYRRIVRIVEEARGKDDVSLIEPLLKLGESFYYFDVSQTGARVQPGSFTGEAYFKRAVRIAEGAKDYPWLDLANARLALADYYVYGDSTNRSRKIYRQVWQSLSEDEDRLAARQRLLENPIALNEGPLPKYVNGGDDQRPAPDEGFLTGTVTVNFTVSPRGRVRNIRSQVTPPEFTDMLRMVHREVRRRVYRPQLVDGTPAESANQVFEHEFFYRDADLDAARKRMEEAEE